MQEDVILYFSSATNVVENLTEIKECGQHMEDASSNEEGWTTVVLKWRIKADKRKGGESCKDDRLYKDVVSSPKPKWMARADLVQDWRSVKNLVKIDKQVRA
ncbi:hypothetical protein C1H46_043693 [Malus baccata]|uniref:Uncharacterized protein n=1 Tax=Malus baccata TaxID=106549 RepID=A0A540K989_MALBA|nr:hypothetical protein C1H46_043693 [Malus baccata]